MVAVVACAMLAGLTGGAALAAFTARESNPQQLTASEVGPGTGVLLARSRSNDGGAGGSQVQLGLELLNRGNGPVSLGNVTMRYWFTADDAEQLVTACYYATFGCGQIGLGLTELPGPRDRADHYLEVTFAGGSLAAGASATLDQLAFRDQAGGQMRQDNDWSFAERSAFADSAHVTVYVGGQLVWGTEPDAVPVTESFELLYANRAASPLDNAIMPGFKLRDTGNVDIDLRRITIRYWFTKDSTSQSLQGFCDYAQIGCGNVKIGLGPVSPARPAADSYLEVGFTGGSLLARGTTGEIHVRIHKADYSNFDERDDHSWATNTTYQQNPKVTAYLDGTLVWGTPP